MTSFEDEADRHSPDNATAAAGGQGKKWYCFLCRRKLPSEDMLKKHQLLSGLHKANLSAHEAEVQRRRFNLRTDIQNYQVKINKIRLIKFLDPENRKSSSLIS